MDQEIETTIQTNLVTYFGGCHCKTVQFEAQTQKEIIVWKCNCSICIIKQNHHFIIPKSQFKLLSGEDNLTLYTFNSHTAKHYFCKTCGVQSFYYPRSNPDGVGVNIYSIKQHEDTTIAYKTFDGENWEQFYIENQDIKELSKATK